VNNLVKVMWPYINVYIRDLMTSTVQPLVNHALPKMLRGSLKFTDISLGESRPVIGPILVRERQRDSCTLDVSVNMDLDLSFTIKVLHARLGVQRVVFSGKFSVVFRPLTSAIPFFGGMEIYLANPPDLDLEFSGIANIAELPGLRGIVRTAISNIINGLFVLPSRIAVDLHDDDDLDAVDLKFPDPLGILRVTLTSATDLVGVNMTLFHGCTSDPYVIAKLGQDAWQSPTVKKTLVPVWKEKNITEFPVYDTSQLICFSVYDDQIIKHDDLIGRSESLQVDRFAAQTGVVENILPLTYKGMDGGWLTFTTEWLTLKDPSERSRTVPHAAPSGGISEMVLLAKILDVTGMPPGFTPPYMINVSVGKQHTACSKGSHPDVSDLRVARRNTELAVRLDEEGMDADTIGKVLQLHPERIKEVLQAEHETDEYKRHAMMKKCMKQTADERALTSPQWNQIVRIIFPWGDGHLASEHLALSLVDSNGKQIGDAYTCLFSTLLESPGGNMRGPFEFIPGDDSGKKSVQMNGMLKVRWLG